MRVLLSLTTPLELYGEYGYIIRLNLVSGKIFYRFHNVPYKNLS